MVAKKGAKRDFNGLSYQELQRVNSNRRKELRKEDQKWLQKNGFKNLGWDNVIQLYTKIEEFFEQYRLEDKPLDALFLEADRIGNKYQTQAEIDDFNQKLAQEMSEIEDEIDRQFTDTEIEVLDFREKSMRNSSHRAKKIKR